MNGIPGFSPAREIPFNKKGSLSDQINNLEEQKKLLQLKLTLHKSLSLPKSMFMYRSVLFAIISLFISLSVYGQKERKIVILHTNDLHSRLEGFAPESMYTPLSVNDDRTLGGFARIASSSHQKNLQTGRHCLLLTAGISLWVLSFTHSRLLQVFSSLL